MFNPIKQIVNYYRRWHINSAKARRDAGYAFAMNQMLTTQDRFRTRDDLLMHVEDVKAFGGYDAFDDGITDALTVFDGWQKWSN